MNLKPVSETMVSRRKLDRNIMGNMENNTYYHLICHNVKSAAINNLLVTVTVNNILHELHLENTT